MRPKTGVDELWDLGYDGISSDLREPAGKASGTGKASNADNAGSIAKDYFKKSLNQVLRGNYTDDVTLLGTAGQVGLGLAGLDFPVDIRDLTYDLTHWKCTPGHVGQTLLDAVGLVPLVGAVKNVDEFGALIKSTVKNADETGAALKNVLRSTDEAAELVSPSLKAAETVSEGTGKIKTTKPFNLNPTHSKKLSNKEFGALVNDIKLNGIHEPIKHVKYNGKMYVVDGHHRLFAAKKLGLTDVPMEEVTLPYKSYKTYNDLFWDD